MYIHVHVNVQALSQCGSEHYLAMKHCFSPFERCKHTHKFQGTLRDVEPVQDCVVMDTLGDQSRGAPKLGLTATTKIYINM